MSLNKSELGITWLGQGGFLIEAGGTRLAVDPYLSEISQDKQMVRSFAPPMSPAELNPDVVCITHDHWDHFDENTLVPIYEQFPNCAILGPESVVRHCVNLGFNPGRIVTLRPKENSYIINGMRIRAVPAFHTEEYAIGLLVEWQRYRIYLSGDTEYDHNLALSVKEALEGSPDIMMICINGKLGNMDSKHAVRLVKELRPRIAIPMHFGLFPANTADPKPFIDEVAKAGTEGMLMEPGKRVVFPFDVSVMRGQKDIKREEDGQS